VYSLFKAPYPFGIFNDISNSRTKWKILLIFFQNFRKNLKRFFSDDQAALTEILQRIFYLFMLLVYLALVFLKIKIKKDKKPLITVKLRKKLEKIYLIQFSLIFIPLIALFTIYEIYNYRDYRSLSPFLWSTFFISILLHQPKNKKFSIILFSLFFIVNLLFFPTVFFNENRYNSQCEGDILPINRIVIFDPNTDYRFDNTMLTDNLDFGLWSRIDPRIGLEYAYKLDFNNTVENYKSRYLLIQIYTHIPEYNFIYNTDYGFLYVKTSNGE